MRRSQASSTGVRVNRPYETGPPPSNPCETNNKKNTSDRNHRVIHIETGYWVGGRQDEEDADENDELSRSIVKDKARGKDVINK